MSIRSSIQYNFKTNTFSGNMRYSDYHRTMIIALNSGNNFEDAQILDQVVLLRDNLNEIIEMAQSIEVTEKIDQSGE